MQLGISIKARTKAFTLMEILVVLAIVASVALPFTNMFVFGVKGSNDNTESVICYNLAREKIEEIKSIPFDFISSDYNNFRQVFRDRPKFDEAYYKEEEFEKVFTDIFSHQNLKFENNRTTFNKMRELYPKTYFKLMNVYPDEIGKYRRVVLAKGITKENDENPYMYKVTVKVFNKKNKTIAQLSTFIGKHK